MNYRIAILGIMVSMCLLFRIDAGLADTLVSGDFFHNYVLILPEASNSERMSLLSKTVGLMIGSNKQEIADMFKLPLSEFKKDTVYLQITTNSSEEKFEDVHLTMDLQFRFGQLQAFTIAKYERHFYPTLCE